MTIMATTLLTIEEIDLLAKGLAKIIAPASDAADAHEASRIIYLHPMGDLPISQELQVKIWSMATHLAELRNTLTIQEPR